METINRQFKAAIFDMDGLILDSERTVLKCWEKIGEKYGFKDIIPYGISVIGKNKKATIDEFERVYGEPGDRYEKELREIYNGLAAEGKVPLKPHTIELLSAMKNSGMKIAIAEDNVVTIDCDIVIGYGQSVVAVAEAVQNAVSSAVESTAAVPSVKVNVNVCGIMRQ